MKLKAVQGIGRYQSYSDWSWILHLQADIPRGTHSDFQATRTVQFLSINIMPLTTAATKLRQLLEDPNGFVTAPGVYDGLSARLALAAGFDALYMVNTTHPNLARHRLKIE